MKSMQEYINEISENSISQFDIYSNTFSIASFHHVASSLSQCPCRVLLAEACLNDWGILNAEQDRGLLNSLSSPLWAAECLKWLNKEGNSIRFSSSGTSMQTIVCTLADGGHSGLVGASPFSSSDLRLITSTVDSLTMKLDESQSVLSLHHFESFWNQATEGNALLKLKEQLHFLADPHPAVWAYYKSCQVLLNTHDESPDELIKKETGFYETTVWNKLYPFQRDGVIACISKLLKYNGCILADSVGLGKTFEALAVIKYFLLRGENVLVLCPKRLRANWSIYSQLGDKRNSLSKDRIHFTLLNHTDLNRETGKSGDIELEHINWGNYGLVVIDESHNFRNRPTHKRKSGSRYSCLLDKVIKEGVPSRVLMLSATPVNNRVADLRNQINIITGDDDSALLNHGITSIEATTNLAQRRFSQWFKFNEEERDTSRLLSMLGQDYFHLLDLLTIARSRKHINTYYQKSMKEAGIDSFPERLKPLNLYPEINSTGIFPPIQEVNNVILKLKMAAYTPLSYLKAGTEEKYQAMYEGENDAHNFRQKDRETNVSKLIRVNLLKRLESSIYSFCLSVNKIIVSCEEQLENIEQFHEAAFYASELDEDDDGDWLDIATSRKDVRILLQDMDLLKWRSHLEYDLLQLKNLAQQAAQINPSNDSKLKELCSIIDKKAAAPINDGNKKIIIFTAFADTANYLYDNLQSTLCQKLQLSIAKVTGSAGTACNIAAIRNQQEDILRHFSPLSKEFNVNENGCGQELDILIATDCISEGQNLQDCDYLINYDIHWNPVRIIQRFGRIDRLGSKNRYIQLLNFWPMENLNEYINLESRVRARYDLMNINATGDENIISEENVGEAAAAKFRLKQLKKLTNEVTNLEDIDGGLSLTDLSMESFRADLHRFAKLHPHAVENWPSYLFATVSIRGLGIPAGVIFCLKAHNEMPPSKEYPLAPYYLVHVAEDGSICGDYKHAKNCLEIMKLATDGFEIVHERDVKDFHTITKNGKDMRPYTRLLKAAINAVTGRQEETQAASIFSSGGTTLGKGAVAKGTQDFEIIAMLSLTHLHMPYKNANTF